MALILSGTDGLSDVDGTAATPAIRGTDTNTGIFFPAADTIAFAEGGTEVARFDSSGRLGIGTTTPAMNLVVKGSTGIAAERDVDTDRLISTYNNINCYANATGANNYNPLTFTQSNNSGSNERMRINSAGSLLVGTTAPISAGFTTISYDGTALNGLVISESANSSGTAFLAFNNGATNIGSVSRVGATSAVQYSTTSDQRLKSNIADANPVLDKLMDVKVRQFDWTDGDLHQDAGFIAQELAPVLSGIVTEGKTTEDMWQVDYSRLTPYLVKAIQELKATVDAQAARIAALENPPVESVTNE